MARLRSYTGDRVPSGVRVAPTALTNAELRVVVAFNLVSTTPDWLKGIGAQPMTPGLCSKDARVPRRSGSENGPVALFGGFLRATTGSVERMALAAVQMDQFALLAVEDQPETVRRLVGGTGGERAFETLVVPTFDDEQAGFGECVVRQQDLATV